MSRRRLVENGWSQSRLTAAVAGGALRPVLPATYLPDHVVTDPLVLLATAREHLGDEVVAVLGTAARLHRLSEPWPPDGRVHVRLPPGREQVQRASFRFHTWKLDQCETTVVDGHRTTTLERTLVDLMCLTDRLSAVAALDAALHRGEIDLDDADRLRRTTTRRRGAARSRGWWTEGDARAESPLETRVRLRASDGGHRPHELQRTFVADGRTFRTDFAWRQANGRWLVGEADGHNVHDVPEALLHDRGRSNLLVATGNVDIVRFTWADTTRPATVPRLLNRILGPPQPR